jgi:hypothetical protein
VVQRCERADRIRAMTTSRWTAAASPQAPLPSEALVTGWPRDLPPNSTADVQEEWVVARLSGWRLAIKQEGLDEEGPWRLGIGDTSEVEHVG